MKKSQFSPNQIASILKVFDFENSFNFLFEYLFEYFLVKLQMQFQPVKPNGFWRINSN